MERVKILRGYRSLEIRWKYGGNTVTPDWTQTPNELQPVLPFWGEYGDTRLGEYGDREYGDTRLDPNS